MPWVELLHAPMGIALIGVLGLAIGSFLNVVIYRLPVMMKREEEFYFKSNFGEEDLQKGETFNLLTPPSRCPHCDNAIRFWQNIPLISYLIQLGRCKYCHQHITMRYFLVEAFTAIISIAIVFLFEQPAQIIFALLFTWTLIALAFIDYECQLLPDVLTLPLMWLGFIAALNAVFIDLNVAVIGAMSGYLSLWCIYWLFKLITGKEGLGYGDFKLLAALGAWQGVTALPLILLIAAASGLLFAFLARIARSTPMAFGPFLIIAGWITFIYGKHLTELLGFNLAILS